MNNHHLADGLASTTIAAGTRAIDLVEAVVSNYSRNIAALARLFRVLVPDLPGLGFPPRADGAFQSQPDSGANAQ